MDTETLIPVFATVSLALYLVSGSNAIPSAWRPWTFRLAILVLVVGLGVALIDTIIYFAG
jgi:hypothetical protein